MPARRRILCDKSHLGFGRHCHRCAQARDAAIRAEIVVATSPEKAIAKLEGSTANTDLLKNWVSSLRKREGGLTPKIAEAIATNLRTEAQRLAEPRSYRQRARQ